jgi:hypothetical protein
MMFSPSSRTNAPQRRQPEAFQTNERNLVMFTVSRFAKTSLLVLLTATLTTAAYARGGGPAGSNGSTGSHVTVHSDARVVTGLGNQTVSKGAVAPHGYCPTCAWHRVIHRPVPPQGAAK